MEDHVTTPEEIEVAKGLAEEIVKALALVSREPKWTDDYGDTWCTLCSGTDEAGVVSHEASCPWQMAVEWCARQR